MYAVHHLGYDPKYERDVMGLVTATNYHTRNKVIVAIKQIVLFTILLS